MCPKSRARSVFVAVGVSVSGGSGASVFVAVGVSLSGASGTAVFVAVGVSVSSTGSSWLVKSSSGSTTPDRDSIAPISQLPYIGRPVPI